MRKSKVTAVFIAAAVLAVALRLFEMLALTEYNTGFIRTDRKVIFYVLSAIIAAAIVFPVVFALSSGPSAEKSKSFNAVISLSSLFLGVAVIVDVLTEKYASVPAALKYICIALGILSAAYFIVFAVRAITYFPLSSKLAALPVLFFTIRASTVFISRSLHAVLSETVFDIAAYCFCMLFFLELARGVNGIADKNNTRKVAALGIAASLICFCSSVPRMLTAVFYSAALHDSGFAGFLPLFTGIYIAAAVFGRITFTSKSERKMGIYYVGKH